MKAQEAVNELKQHVQDIDSSWEDNMSPNMKKAYLAKEIGLTVVILATLQAYAHLLNDGKKLYEKAESRVMEMHILIRSAIHFNDIAKYDDLKRDSIKIKKDMIILIEQGIRVEEEAG